MKRNIVTVLFTVVLTIPWSARAEGETRDPATAGLMSGGVTFAGALTVAIAIDRDSPALAIAGGAALALGPTTGHWYAGRSFNSGLGVRLCSVAVAAAGAALVATGDPDSRWCTGDHCEAGTTMLVMVAPAMYIGGTLYEIVTAPESARAYNRRHRRDLDLTPTVLDGGAGMALAGRF